MKYNACLSSHKKHSINTNLLYKVLKMRTAINNSSQSIYCRIGFFFRHNDRNGIEETIAISIYLKWFKTQFVC